MNPSFSMFSCCLCWIADSKRPTTCTAKVDLASGLPPRHCSGWSQRASSSAPKVSRLRIGRATSTGSRHPAKSAAQSAWKPFLDDEPPSDLDSLLRVVDMAAHYRADKRKIYSFLTRAIARRSQLAQHAGLSVSATRKGDRASYTAMRIHCDAARLLAETDALATISLQFRTKGVVEGQQSLM